MRYPYANEICENFPKNQWFRIPVEVDRIYPDISSWDRSVVLTRVCNYLIRKIKWGEVARKNTDRKQIVFFCI